MTPALFPYQEAGAAFLASRSRALLCDEMGLGKTPQAIVAAQRVGARAVLVLAPAAVVTNWRREWARWAPGAPEPVVLSYDKARSPATLNNLRARRWDLLICDEAHYLKNRMAARTQAVLGPRCDELGGLVACADRAWGLTGTPMPNTADELWALLRAFGPDALRGASNNITPYWSFRKRYCVEVPIGAGRSKIVGLRHAEDLRARIAPVLLRRKKADVLKDLPPLREGEIALSAEGYMRELDHLEAGESGAIVRKALAASLVSDNVDRCVAMLLEASSDDSVSRLRRLTATIKARALAPLLAEEMEQTDEKMVVFGWHRETLDVLEERLAPFGAVRLSGDTPAARRQEAIDAFQIDPRTRVFLGQIAAAGTGITLTAAANLVFAEMSWTPADNAQAAMRVHRVGQGRPVLIRYAVLADTIDEAVVRTLRRKSQDIRNVLEGTS